MFNDSLTELSGRLARKEVSSAELTAAFLGRIDRLNGALNAFITLKPRASAVTYSRPASSRSLSAVSAKGTPPMFAVRTDVTSGTGPSMRRSAKAKASL